MEEVGDDEEDVIEVVTVLVGVTVVCEVMDAELVAVLAEVLLVDMMAVDAAEAVNQRLVLVAVAM